VLLELGGEQRLLQAVPDAGDTPCALVAVVTGRGIRQIFESLGAYVVDGGRTMNPSTAELLAAVEATGAREAIVLPNDRNVFLTAEHAAEAASRPVSVLPIETLQAGLAAAVAFDPALSREENLAEMAGVAAEVGTGAVTLASRDLETNGLAIRKGQWLGLADGAPVAGGESFDEVARVVVERLLERPRGILTLLTGEDAQPVDGLLAEIATAHPDLEIDVRDGGQPSYPLLLGAE